MDSDTAGIASAPHSPREHEDSSTASEPEDGSQTSLSKANASTAIAAKEDAPGPTTQAPSPTLQTKRSHLAKPQLGAIAPQDDSEVFSSQPRVRYTYGKRHKLKFRADTPTGGDEPDISESDHPPNTSDPIETPKVAREAASRSVSYKHRSEAQGTSTKNLAVEAADEQDEHGIVKGDIKSSKNKMSAVRQSGIKRKALEMRDSKDEFEAALTSTVTAAEEDKQKETETGFDDTSPRKRSRLPTASQRSEQSPDEIVVARPPIRSKAATPKSNSLLAGKTPKVLISGSDVDKGVKTWFKKKKVELIDDPPARRTYFVCVVKDKVMPTTLKVLASLLAGKSIVTHKWMLESKKEGRILDPESFIHPNQQNDVTPADRRSLFAKSHVFFTLEAAHNYMDWQAVEEIVKGAGALSVTSGSAQKGHDLTPKDRVIFFGEDNDRDKHAHSLIANHGRIVYHKTMLAQSIIRGAIDLDSVEFRLSVPLGKKKVTGRKKK